MRWRSRGLDRRPAVELTLESQQGALPSMEWRSMSPAAMSPHCASPAAVRQRPLLAVALLLALLPLPSLAESGLLESVKRNPALARKLCEEFRNLNGAGQMAFVGGGRGRFNANPVFIQRVQLLRSDQALSASDAEVVMTYTIGLHCSDVR